MTLEEWRKKYVGKLIRPRHHDAAYTPGICTRIEESNEDLDDELEVYFRVLDDVQESMYYIESDNPRHSWWIELWEGEHAS